MLQPFFVGLKVSMMASISVHPRSREYLAVHRNFTVMIESLSAEVDPSLFAQSLRECDLVSANVLAKASVRAVPVPSRVQDLIAGVQSQINLDPSRYHTFIKVLRYFHPLLAKKLTSFFGKCSNSLEIYM